MAALIMKAGAERGFGVEGDKAEMRRVVRRASASFCPWSIDWRPEGTDRSERGKVSNCLRVCRVCTLERLIWTGSCCDVRMERMKMERFLRARKA